jgi:signal transduction histidine kinase
LITGLFALIPVPVAIVDDGGRVVSNSAFTDLFEGIQNIQSIPHHEVEICGRGIYELQTVPLNDQGMTIVYATEVSNEVQLRRQVVHLEKMAAIGRLVSGVAHELNNPLAGILGYAQLVAREELQPSTHRMVQVILAQAERAERIVHNFLSLAAKTEPKRIPFDLNDTLCKVIQLRELQEAVENIVVTTDLSNDLPFAWGDPHQIEQVFLNLIVNAEHAIVDAQRQPGSIHVTTSVEGGRLQVTVADNGSGIHARDMAQIFDAFFTTKSENRGTGLGLSICSEIVRITAATSTPLSTGGMAHVYSRAAIPRRDQAGDGSTRSCFGGKIPAREADPRDRR